MFFSLLKHPTFKKLQFLNQIKESNLNIPFYVSQKSSATFANFYRNLHLVKKKFKFKKTYVVDVVLYSKIFIYVCTLFIITNSVYFLENYICYINKFHVFFNVS